MSIGDLEYRALVQSGFTGTIDDMRKKYFTVMSQPGRSMVGGGEPSQFTSRSLTSADNGAVLICESAQTATVPSGLPSGFGCSFKGAISFTAGAGVTVTDVRTTGAAAPWCALVQTAANTYDVVGGKS